MPSRFTEYHIEQALLEYLLDLGWAVVHGPEIAPGEPGAEREDYSDVLLAGRLRTALRKLNPGLPEDALDDAYRQIANIPNLHPSTAANNRAFHQLLVEGVDVTYRNTEGRDVTQKACLVDFEDPTNNDLLAVNQFTVKDLARPRRLDVVLFVNGMPLVLVELKNPADEKADIHKAFNQIQTYKAELPALFSYNEICVISDGAQARAGAFLAPFERFMRWRTIEGQIEVPRGDVPLETLARGMLDPNVLLDLLHHFIVFEEADGETSKKLAGYHQFHAVNLAVGETVSAVASDGDRRIGVVWHTQGSGKSLTMAFYAGKIIAVLNNPTLVVITDRNDLDDQLFGTFVAARDLMRQRPRQAESRQHLKDLLKVASGGVVFTTAQKFFPESKGDQYELLSERRNVVVIADEAHRSQYGFITGFARHMRDALPNAAFIGFTATPLDLDDRNTRHVFGDYISVYDIKRSIADEMTVPIHYEARLAKIGLDEKERPRLDEDFEDITELEEEKAVEQLKSKWARLEAAVGTPKRLGLIAEDIVAHFDARQTAMDGKAMIVAMSRRIAVELYNELVRLRPEWHSEADQQGAIKVVMSGSASDPVEWQQHIRSKAGRKEIEKRFKDVDDPLKIVIVRDMWLTGFDVPALHTMYLDKPMKGHALMQAIARVNRVFRDKPGGLVVDYLGVAEALRDALATYTRSDGKGELTVDQREAVAVMLEKYEIITDMLNGLDWSGYFGDSQAERARVVANVSQKIVEQMDGKQRFIQHVTELSKAFALAVPQPETYDIRDDLGFFQHVRSWLAKNTEPDDLPGKTTEELDTAVRQIVASAVVPEGVLDIFSVAGIDKPDLSILSEEFLQGIKNMPQKNLAVEVLRKLLMDEIKLRSKANLVMSRKFSEMLENTIRKYQNRTIEAVEVVLQLIDLARDIQAADARGEELNLNREELAFYDALAANESAREVMGDAQLSVIAREVLNIVRNNVAIDWTVKENIRANLRRLVKRALRKHGYPPDMQESATRTVLEQAELIAGEWAV